MSLIENLKPTGGVIPLLVFILGGVCVMSVAVPRKLDGALGGCFIAVGALSTFLHRSLGRAASRQTLSVRLSNNFWERVGERGAQGLYLWIGLILTSVGLILTASWMAQE